MALASVIVAGAAAAFAVAAAVGDPVAGKKVFQTAGCTGCHTLAAVGSTGTVGPNLDQRKPAYNTVVARVTSGRGVMPAFGGILSAQQIADVAAFVSQATGGAPAAPPPAAPGSAPGNAPLPTAPTAPGPTSDVPGGGLGPRPVPRGGGAHPVGAEPTASLRVTSTDRRLTSSATKVSAGTVTVALRNLGRAPLRVVAGRGAPPRSSIRLTRSAARKMLAVPRGASRRLTLRLRSGERGYVCRVVRRHAGSCVSFRAVSVSATPVGTDPASGDAGPVTVAPPPAPPLPAADPWRPAPAPPAPPTAPAEAPVPLDGKSLFRVTCGGCHTLADAGTTGAVGPNLDKESPNADKVRKQVLSGGGGMPSFRGVLTTEQTDLIARYIASVT